jgi:hypothetical protein
MKTAAANLRVRFCRCKFHSDERDMSTAKRCEGDDDTLSLYCGERLEERNGGEWIVCMECQQWKHEEFSYN